MQCNTLKAGIFPALSVVYQILLKRKRCLAIPRWEALNSPGRSGSQYAWGERVGLSDRVTFKLRDISEGFDERWADALFLDLPNPYDYIPQVREALKPGGFFGSLLPTVNQVSRLLISLQRENFAFIEVCETFLRYYQADADKLRPTDRMIAHTGYLIFARSIQQPFQEDDERGSADLSQSSGNDTNDSDHNDEVQ